MRSSSSIERDATSSAAVEGRWPCNPVTFPVTNQPALAGASWRCRGPKFLIYAGGRWSASSLGG